MFNRAKEDRELNDELAAFMEGLVAEKIAAGMTPEAARRAALLEVGGVEQVKEATRDIRSGILIETALKDLRYAVRSLRRSPIFSVAVIATLGLAIGATTAIFSIVNPVLLQPLPYPHPDRLAFVWERDANGGNDNVGYATYRDLVASASTLEHAAVVGGWDPTLTGPGEPEVLTGHRVSWDFFRVLGVTPEYGRDFLQSDDTPGNQLVIISHRLFVRRFNGDHSIVGQTISLNGAPATVAGVMPDFDYVLSPDVQIWRVLGYANQPWACRTCHHLRMVVRVKDGVPMSTAQRELTGIHNRLEKEYPKEYSAVGAAVVPVKAEMTKKYQPGLAALGVAVLLMLLIALANVVSLQLARAVQRKDEFAVRAALGASRLRLLQQLLCEGLILAAFGGLLGLVVARGALPTLIARLPDRLPRIEAIHLDSGALGVVAVLVIVVAMVMGFAPLGRRMNDLTDSLRSGRRSSAAHHRVRALLVVGEVALAMVLLVCAGLITRSLSQLLSVDPGFNPTHLVAVSTVVSGPKYSANEAILAYHERMIDAALAVPGVKSVATTNQLPLSGDVDRYAVVDADNMPDNPELGPNGDRYAVSPGYFATMGIPLVAGRFLTSADARDSANKVVVVSAALAHELWPNGDALGKQIRVGDLTAGPRRTVVGVVGNVHHDGLDATVNRQWYMPERQWLEADKQEVLVARTNGDPEAMISAMRKAVSAVDPTQPIIATATMDQMIARSTAQRRLAVVLFSTFAAAALLLAMAGIYGVLAGSVAERTREIGVRSALGATPGQILALVLRQGGSLAAAGILIGAIGSLAGTRFLRTLLFGIGPNDPATLLAVLLLLGMTTVLSCLIPARRATRVDPSRALRE